MLRAAVGPKKNRPQRIRKQNGSKDVFLREIKPRDSANMLLDKTNYRLLIAAMTESFSLRELVFDSSGKARNCRFLEINPAFEKFIGLPRSAIIGKLRSEIPVPIDPAAKKIYIQTALTGKPAHFENYNETLKKHFSVYVYSPAKNQFATIFTDITGQKRSEEKIEHLASFPGNNPNPIIEINASGKVLYANPTAKKILAKINPADGAGPFLRKPIKSIVANSSKNHFGQLCFYDEIETEGRTFAEDICVLEKHNAIRIYAKDITARKQIEEKLGESEKKYRSLFENIGEMMAIYKVIRNKKGAIVEKILVEGNPEIAKAANVKSIEEIRGKTFSEIFGKDYSDRSIKPIGKIMNSGKTGSFESYDSRTGKNYLTTVTPIDKDFYLAAAKDITAIKKAENNLNRLNRTLKALNGVNRSTLRARDENELLKDVCRIVVRDCGHKMVWIGFAQNDEKKTVKPEAWFGFEKGYLETLKLTWNDSERGRGPTGTAIRTQKPYVCRDMTADPRFAPWCKEAIKRGYASSLAVPLNAGGKILGAITIYSKNANSFTDDEIELLAQLANDTAFGVYALRLRKTHAKTAEKLRQTGEYLENLLNYANAPIIVWDPNFKITKFNRAFERMTGLKSDRVLNKSLEILFPAISKKKSMDLIKSTLAGKRWEIVEIPIKRIDGEIRTVIWNSANILNDSGAVIATVAQGQDITDRKNADEKRMAAENALKKHARELEKAVRELENLQLAVENASDIIFTADSKGVILSINKAIENLLGYKPGEVIGKKMRILGVAANQKHYDTMWKMVKKDKKSFMVEITNKKKNGREMIFELYVSPVLNSKKEVIFLVGVVRDRTEAKETDRAKTEFISLAAHQLRTPLSTISMASEMMVNGNVGQIDEIAKDQLQEICSTTHKMADMIELFLNISRIELGRIEINPEPLDIVDFARGLAKEIAPQAAAKNVRFKTDFEPELPAVNIDRKIMHIALENLLTNAIKYTQKGGQVAFSIRRDNNCLVASVADNGRGIPKSELGLVFTKMFRADNVGEVKGLGLGLNMTKSAIEQSGGSVSVQSEENKGSTFSISIPLSGMKKRSIRMEP